MGSYPELQERKAIVTGATAGIGKSIALSLGKEGVDVALVGRNQERGEAVENTLRELGTQSFFVRCDVRYPEEMEAAHADIVRRLGKVDILVNCAGIVARHAKVSEYTVAEWDDSLNSNLRSAFLFTKLVLPGMVEQRWGRIVNISSAVAQGVHYFTSSIYAAAKAGMLGFTRQVAMEVAAYGVTVNATTPTLTRSERIESVMTPEQIANVVKNIPVGRISELEEQASVVVFLCSDRASFITGATINVSGGVIFN